MTKKCYNDGDFYKYFKANMNALNLPAPKDLFGTFNAAVANASAMATALQTLGPGATVAEIFGATVATEKLAVIAGFGAAGYTGAVIGSLSVATGRSLACGSQIIDLFSFTSEHQELRFQGMTAFYSSHPEILSSSHPHKKTYGIRLKSSPSSFELIA